jgi:hypothetical protein
MNLRSFDIATFLETPLVHKFSDEWSRPGLTNFLGSLQADADPTGIRHVLFPPVSGADEATCYLTINGELLAATGVETTVRWAPHQIVRECRWREWMVRGVLATVPGEHAVVQRITVTSMARAARPLQLGIRLSGRCINRGLRPWNWQVPLVSTSVFELIQDSGLDPIVRHEGDGCVLFQERKLTRAQQKLAATGQVTSKDFREMGRAFNAQCLRPAPDTWLSNGDACFQRTMKPRETFTIDFALAMDSTDKAAKIARDQVRRVPEVIAEQEQLWRELWRNAFQEGNPQFSGALPDLDVPKALMPVAASAVFNLLLCRRTHRAAKGKAWYNILTPRRCELCFYTWDWGLSTGALARLDPEPVKRQLEMVWKNDFCKVMQFNFLTGEGTGWTYSADIFSLFFATWNYWKARGGTAGGLSETLSGARGKRTLLECFEELAFDWRSRRHSKFGLADYGPKGHLLECVTTYAHMVAALNAAACWMLERVADLYELSEREGEAAGLRKESAQLLAKLIEHLYVQGGGYFACMQPDGRKIECRHAYDLGMVLLCVGERLPEAMKQEMADFFQRELQTPGWIRALSPHDRDAVVSGVRADHQFSGSYTAWAGLAALGLLKIGRRDIVEGWLPGIAKTALQGPFGQAHWDEQMVTPTAGGATKASDELPQGTHWCDISGAIYFNVIEAFIRKEPEPARAKRHATPAETRAIPIG